MKNILVLCTGNSARSVMGEVTLNRYGAGSVRAFSAGSQPTGKINPYVKQHLEHEGYDITGVRSKSWDEFSGSDAPLMDIIITVCDNAAGETCPIWVGAPVQVHCGFADPATVKGSDAAVASRTAEIYRAIEAFAKAVVALLETNPDDAALRRELQALADDHQMLDR